MTDIISSILAINANAKCTVNGEDANNVTWHDGTTPITPADILTKQKELQTAYDNVKYQRDRATAYPAIADQLDDLYHNGIDGWKTKIKSVNDKYPKG